MQGLQAAGAPAEDARPLLPWWGVGLLLAGLELVVFATQHRGIGASTSYEYIAGMAWPALRNATWAHIAAPGAWENWFLLGGFLGAWLMARLRAFIGRTARPAAPTARRVAAAFFGGFLLIFGARLADGCTSGHILSGGIQLADSSLWFALCAIVAGVVMIRVLRATGSV